MESDNREPLPVEFNPQSPAEIREARQRMLNRVARGCPPHVACLAEGVSENWEEDEIFAAIIKRAEYSFIADVCERHGAVALRGEENAQVSFFLQSRAGLSTKEGIDGFSQKVVVVPETVDGTQPPPEKAK